MVDIYLPDFKYGLEEDGVNFSAAPEYPRFAVDSLQEMVRQVGAEPDLGDEAVMDKKATVGELPLVVIHSDEIRILDEQGGHLVVSNNKAQGCLTILV